MSPLWRDQLRIALMPGALAWARYRRGVSRRRPETVVLPLTAQRDAPVWEPAIDALEALVARQPRAVPAWALLGSAHLARGDAARGVEARQSSGNRGAFERGV